jgi:hypothetical protein
MKTPKKVLKNADRKKSIFSEGFPPVSLPKDVMIIAVKNEKLNRC